MPNPLRRRSVTDLPPLGKLVAYLILGSWALVVLFPLYWLAITSFKLPIQVNAGPVYIPFVDFRPSLDAWRYIFVDLRSDTLRPYMNTVVVALGSSTLALLLGSAAAYALIRFPYRPRVGVIALFAGCLLVAALAVALGVPPVLAVVVAGGCFAVLAGAVGSRFTRTLSNRDIAFWMISQRILPPVAVVIPIYVLFQHLGLLDTRTALVITYAATNLPIVVWLMRDYFDTLPWELEEAAVVDGASAFRVFRSVTLPLSVPGLVATFLIVFVFAWNEYLLALFLSSADAQTMPLTVAAQNATRGPQWWYMSVLIQIMIVPVVALAIALERVISRGLLVGAVKG
ncbi:MAG TPA: carbohydrate ABC transporter permease [Actinomycetes bacterium]|jgi:multiple sugar transport system permease protein|nr:carbohydrate ABC transporter permease [Actinomycetes bacterium]